MGIDRAQDGVNNWREALPGFWLPNSWQHDESRWPDYTDDGYIRAISDTPDLSSVIRLRGYGQPTPQQWGAWLGSFNADRDIRTESEFLAVIADRKYESARFAYLVPAWRRAIIDVVTEIDDIEDQVSTILWVLETVARKWIPIPPGILNAGERLSKTLDCGGKILAGITPFRGRKSEYGECLAEIGRKKRRAKEQKAGMIAWLQENWGRMLEAAQATNSWFDVGIVLGPIQGYIEEGLWGLMRESVNSKYLILEAVIPGSQLEKQVAVEVIRQQVESVWDSLWSGIEDNGDGDWAVNIEQWEQ